MKYKKIIFIVLILIVMITSIQAENILTTNNYIDILFLSFLSGELKSNNYIDQIQSQTKVDTITVTTTTLPIITTTSLTTSSTTIVSSTTTLPTIQTNITLHPGWNLISIPTNLE